ncbi:hypothetical protein [Methylocucumis oryzae]|uniref:hypothetical protein n=1 Tax=Methylocucumis oryzae TaxID=1632867 RepID=UPI00103A10C5|nr:hypothetical protein [Methylocucumis oryzae]
MNTGRIYHNAQTGKMAIAKAPLSPLQSNPIWLHTLAGTGYSERITPGMACSRATQEQLPITPGMACSRSYCRGAVFCHPKYPVPPYVGSPINTPMMPGS